MNINIKVKLIVLVISLITLFTTTFMDSNANLTESLHDIESTFLVDFNKTIIKISNLNNKISPEDKNNYQKFLMLKAEVAYLTDDSSELSKLLELLNKQSFVLSEEHLSRMYMFKGYIGKVCDDNDKASNYFDVALTLARNTENTKTLIQALNAKGQILADHGKYYESIKILNEAYSLNSEKMYPLEYLYSLVSIGETKFYLNDFDSAIVDFERSISIIEKNNISNKLHIVSAALLNDATTHIKLEEYLEANETIDKIQKNKNNNKLTTAFTYKIKAEILKKTNTDVNFKKAELNLQRAMKILSEEGYVFYLKNTQALYSELLIDNGFNEEALKVLLNLNSDINEKTNFKNNLIIYKGLYRAYENLNKYELSYFYHKKYTKLSKKVYDQKNMMILAEISENINNDLLEKNNVILSSDQNQQAQLIVEKINQEEKNRYVIYFSISVVTILLFLIIVLIYFAKKYFLIANTDSLTNLKNRRFVMDKLNKMFEQKNTEKSLILLDVDHFKKINDTYGHSAGDNVLKDLSKIFQKNVRKNDIVSRFGGEEFLIVINGNINIAFNIAERIRLDIEQHSFYINKDIAIQSTSSFGVSESTLGHTLYQTINLADTALYKAKHSGRNTVRIAD